jgi:hypothetical protein
LNPHLSFPLISLSLCPVSLSLSLSLLLSIFYSIIQQSSEKKRQISILLTVINEMKLRGSKLITSLKAAWESTFSPSVLNHSIKLTRTNRTNGKVFISERFKDIPNQYAVAGIY